MEKKEMVMGIIDLFDELQKTREELNILRTQIGLSKIEGKDVEIKTEPTKFDSLFDLVIDDFLERYEYTRKSVLEGDKIVPFEEWFKSLSVEDCVGWANENKLLEVAGKNDIKKYFKSGLKRWYNKAVETEKAKGLVLKTKAESEEKKEV